MRATGGQWLIVVKLSLDCTQREGSTWRGEDIDVDLPSLRQRCDTWRRQQRRQNGAHMIQTTQPIITPSDRTQGGVSPITNSSVISEELNVAALESAQQEQSWALASLGISLAGCASDLLRWPLVLGAFAAVLAQKLLNV
eukprot:5805722-Amphidinium_carterae.1